MTLVRDVQFSKLAVDGKRSTVNETPAALT